MNRQQKHKTLPAYSHAHSLVTTTMAHTRALMLAQETHGGVPGENEAARRR